VRSLALEGLMLAFSDHNILEQPGRFGGSPCCDIPAELFYGRSA